MVFMRAIILAGGESSRMGQDKAFVVIQGKPLLQWQLDTFMQANIPTTVLANDNKLLKLADTYRDSSLIEMATDVEAGIQGPLSGLLSGMRLLNKREHGAVIVLSCDVFGLPASVFDALNSRRVSERAEIACLNIAGRMQPLIAVLDSALADNLSAYFSQGGRSVMHWYRQHDVVFLTETDLLALDLHGSDYATNLNTMDDVNNFLQNRSNEHLI